MSIWILICLMALVTFSVRFVFIARTIRFQMGSRVRLLLRYSSFSILTALWTHIVFQYEVTDGFSHAVSAYLIAAAVAMVMATLRINTLAVVLTSVGLFFLLRFYL